MAKGSIAVVNALSLNPISPIYNNSESINRIADVELKTRKVSISNKKDNNRFRIKLNLADRLTDLANNHIKEAIMPEYLASNN